MEWCFGGTGLLGLPDPLRSVTTGSLRKGATEIRWRPLLVTVRQNTFTPNRDSASVTGWKNVVPPEVQLPLPPEVRPSAVDPANREPPLSPGSAQTLVRIRPVTVPSW